MIGWTLDYQDDSTGQIYLHPRNILAAAQESGMHQKAVLALIYTCLRRPHDAHDREVAHERA